MKKSYLSLFVIVFFIKPLLSQQQFSSPGYLYCIAEEVGSSFSSTSNTCNLDYISDYKNSPVVTIYLNIHIFETSPLSGTSVLVSRAKDFVRFANESLMDMQPNWRNGPNGVIAPHVPSAKIRYKLYTDTSNFQDTNGGVWIYPTRTEDPSKHVIELNLPYVKRYGNNVIDVVWYNYPISSNSTGAALLGGASLGGGSNLIRIADFNGATFIDLRDGNEDWRRAVSRAFNHEVGHILNLKHSSDCSNPCGGIDLDVQQECGPKCPSLRTCDNFNPGKINCNGITVDICTWANSRNMMAQGWWDDALTPCQWETMLNHMLNIPKSYNKICPTAQTITLTSSPLNDYRASTQITSNSIVAANRDLTYQAPLIKLNGGFKVSKGTYFLASPSTFPCCTAPPNAVGVANTSQPISITDQEQVQIQVAPNPFSDYLNIQFLFSEKQGRLLKIEIFDINGKLIHAVNTNDGSDLMLDTKEYASGYYSLKVTSENWNKVIPIIKY
jgi:hypothetical protein